jgi:two-component system chemotaxis response regulator CheY
MIGLDDELGIRYLAESREHLATIESSLLALEKDGAQIDEEHVNGAFRAVHSIKGGACFFDLAKIRELSHQAEDVLALIRSRKLAPTQERIGVLLRATDWLGELIQNPATSNQADISEILTALSRLPAEQLASAGESHAGEGSQPCDRRLRTLLVEDDFTSRLVLQSFLSSYGDCHIAVNGLEAVDAFGAALAGGLPYDLVCMDIMMPEMDGREAVRRVRAMEEAAGILSTHGAKIVMTTAVNDIKEVIRCFRELADAYLMKPIDLTELLRQMEAFRLVR